MQDYETAKQAYKGRSEHEADAATVAIERNVLAGWRRSLSSRIHSVGRERTLSFVNEGLKWRCETLENKNKEIEEELKKMKARVGNVETECLTVGKRVDAVESQIRNVSDTVAATDAELSTVKVKTEKLGGSVGNIEERVEKQEEKIEMVYTGGRI